MNEFSSSGIQPPRYRIVVAESHSEMRFGICTLLNRTEGLHVVGEASDAFNLIDRLRQIACDLVILDLRLPDMNGLDTLRALRTNFPHVKVLVVSPQEDIQYVQKVVAMGIHGYVVTEDNMEALPEACRAIVEGSPYFSERVRYLRGPLTPPGFSPS